jgi:hypothetical protein
VLKRRLCHALTARKPRRKGLLGLVLAPPSLKPILGAPQQVFRAIGVAHVCRGAWGGRWDCRIPPSPTTPDSRFLAIWSPHQPPVQNRNTGDFAIKMQNTPILARFARCYIPATSPSPHRYAPSGEGRSTASSYRPARVSLSAPAFRWHRVSLPVGRPCLRRKVGGTHHPTKKQKRNTQPETTLLKVPAQQQQPGSSTSSSGETNCRSLICILVAPHCSFVSLAKLGTASEHRPPCTTHSVSCPQHHTAVLLTPSPHPRLQELVASAHQTHSHAPAALMYSCQS